MTEEEQRLRDLIGPEAVKAAQEAALSAPSPSPELLNRIALLLRTLRRKPVDAPEQRDDVA